MYMIMGWDNLTEETSTWKDIKTFEYAKSLLKNLSVLKTCGELRYTELKLYKEIEL